MAIKITRLLLIAIIIASLSQTCDSTSQVNSSEKRIVTVAAFGDEEFRKSPAWQFFIEAHLRDISQIYDSIFGIQLKLTSMNEWESPNHALELGDLLIDLKRFSNPCTTDVVIGFSLQEPSKLEKEGKVEFSLGVAKILSSQVVVRFNLVEIRNDYLVRGVLMHEIAHLFGGFHSSDSNTIMFPYADKAPASLEFDEQTTRMIRLLKVFPFCSGILCLDTNAHRLVTNIFQQGHFPGEQNPIASALQERALEYLEQGAYDSTSRLFYSALPHYDVTTSQNLSDYSVALMWASFGYSSIKLDSAAVVGELAIKLDPGNKKALNNLGKIYSENNQPEKAIELFEKALEIDSLYFNAAFGMSIAYLRMNEAKSALRYLEKAVKLNPNHTKARYFFDSLKSDN